VSSNHLCSRGKVLAIPYKEKWSDVHGERVVLGKRGTITKMRREIGKYDSEKIGSQKKWKSAFPGKEKFAVLDGNGSL